MKRGKLTATIREMLFMGPHHVKEISLLLEAPEQQVRSALETMFRYKYVVRVAPATYQLTRKGERKALSAHVICDICQEGEPVEIRYLLEFTDPIVPLALCARCIK